VALMMGLLYKVLMMGFAILGGIIVTKDVTSFMTSNDDDDDIQT